MSEFKDTLCVCRQEKEDEEKEKEGEGSGEEGEEEGEQENTTSGPWAKIDQPPQPEKAPTPEPGKLHWQLFLYRKGLVI